MWSELFYPLTNIEKSIPSKKRPFKIMHFMKEICIFTLQFLIFAYCFMKRRKRHSRDCHPQSKQFHTVKLQTSLLKLLVCSNYYGSCSLTGVLISPGTAYLHMITGFNHSLQIHYQTWKKKEAKPAAQHKNVFDSLVPSCCWLDIYSIKAHTHSHFSMLAWLCP